MAATESLALDLNRIAAGGRLVGCRPLSSSIREQWIVDRGSMKRATLVQMWLCLRFLKQIRPLSMHHNCQQ